MVDAISGSTVGSLSTLLRAQSTGYSAGIAALKSNQQATQAIINQLQKTAEGTQVSMSQASADSSLPRGSLIDIIA